MCKENGYLNECGSCIWFDLNNKKINEGCACTNPARQVQYAQGYQEYRRPFNRAPKWCYEREDGKHTEYAKRKLTRHEQEVAKEAVSEFIKKCSTKRAVFEKHNNIIDAFYEIAEGMA